MKRKVALIMAAVLMVVSLGACSSTTSSSYGTESAESENNVRNSGEKVTLTVWQLKPEIADTLPEVFEVYMKENPNVEIVVDRPGGNDYDTTIKAQMASGVYPDLCMVNSYSVMESFAKGGNATAITDYSFVDNFVDGVLPSITYDGEIYGVPCELDGVGVIYNRTIFEEVGLEIPTTLSEMEEVCQKLKDAGITPFAVGLKDSWTMNQTFSLIHGEIMDAYEFTDAMNRGEASFTDAELDGAFDFLDLMVANCNDKPSDSDYSNMCTLFAQGECAMMVCGMWGMTSVLMIDPDIETGVFAVPVSENPEDAKLCTGNAAVFIMPPQSVNQEETLKLMEWMSGEEFAQLYAEKCGIYMPTKNATLPLEASSAWENIKSYIDEGNITSLPFLYYPSGFDAGIALQTYFNGESSQEDVRNAWDELWKSLTL